MREVELFVIGAEVGEKVEAFIKRAVGLGVRLVNLVENDNGLQAKC